MEQARDSKPNAIDDDCRQRNFERTQRPGIPFLSGADPGEQTQTFGCAVGEQGQSNVWSGTRRLRCGCIIRLNVGERS